MKERLFHQYKLQKKRQQDGIVRGKENLDVVDKVIREIDVRTKQVLIEAFIVEASTFERALGNKLGAAYTEKEQELEVQLVEVQLGTYRYRS